MSSRIASVAGVLAAIATLAATVAAQQVHVVGTRPAPGVDFSSVQAAVDAVSSGDVLLLLPGDHAGPVTVTKELVLLGQASPDGTPPALQELIVGQTEFAAVAVRGIRLSSPSPTSGDNRYALRASGPSLVWIEDSPSSEGPGQDARFDSSGRVVLVRCAFTGDKGVYAGTLGASSLPGTALVESDTEVALFECQFTGGAGAPAKSGFFSVPAQPGAYGLALGSGAGWTLASRVVVEGGAGGAGASSGVGPCEEPGDGGTALYVASLLRSRLLEPIGGSPGAMQPGCPGGASGALFDVVLSGSVVPLPGLPPRLEVSALLVPGEVAQLRFEGPPGQPVLLIAAPAPTLHWLPGPQSALAVGSDSRALVLGTTDERGVIDLPIPVPPGILQGAGPRAALLVYLQAVCQEAEGFALSNPTMAAILDVP